MRRYLPALRRCLPIIITALILLLTIATCDRRSEEEPQPEPEPSVVIEPSTIPEPTPEEPEQEPEPEPAPYDGPENPLTGLPVETDISKNRPYAIMIGNSSDAQPQLGVSGADIIYEVPAEGNITRMMAVFQDVKDAGVIGSIRSSRPYYVDLAQGHDAIYIFAGGSNDAYQTLSSRNITRLDGVNGRLTDIYYRDSSRRRSLGYTHSLVTSGDLITRWLPTYNFRLEHSEDYESPLQFTDNGAPENGLPALDFSVKFLGSKTTSFTYDADDGKYYLRQHGSKYLDGSDGSQLAVTNVLILQTAVSQIRGDTEGRLTVTLTGGRGYFVCGGQYIDIKWSKDSVSAPLVYTLEDGSELYFGRGNTYVCVVPAGTAVEIK